MAEGLLFYYTLGTVNDEQRAEKEQLRLGYKLGGGGHDTYTS
jgi:hypothetical protein